MGRAILCGAALLAVAPPALAQVSLGVRVGYAAGFGRVGGTLDMDDWVDDQVPLQIDALYRLNPRVALGAFFSYGFARSSGDLRRDSCDALGADCSASILRAGVQGTYTFDPVKRLVPWLGAGIGYEWNRFSNDAEAFEITFSGWEYLSLQGGLDYELSPRFRVGPFLLFSVSQYGGEADVPSSPEVDGSIEGGELHEWLTIGVRGRFDL